MPGSLPHPGGNVDKPEPRQWLTAAESIATFPGDIQSIELQPSHCATGAQL
jgi:hypothetical protein